MTKKDYELIARTIKNTLHTYSKGSKVDAWYVLGDLASALSQELEQDNPRFNPRLFQNACK